MLTAAFTLPGIVGGASVYYLIQTFPNLDLTYVFALALGTSVYAMLRLVRPLYVGGGSRGVSLKVAAAVILGFACLYTAGLLHA